MKTLKANGAGDLKFGRSKTRRASQSPAGKPNKEERRGSKSKNKPFYTRDKDEEEAKR